LCGCAGLGRAGAGHSLEWFAIIAVVAATTAYLTYSLKLNPGWMGLDLQRKYNSAQMYLMEILY
jgi:hypothetical protein